MRNDQNKRRKKTKRQWRDRRGIIIVLTAFLLTVLFAFVALSVDTGRIVMTQTKMQNAVDAASLAASHEITSAIDAASHGSGTAGGASASAVAAARTMAQQVAAANGVYIDPNSDVKFGNRTMAAGSGSWHTSWGTTPYNVVQVNARRTEASTTAPDGKFPLAFGWAVGKSSVPLQTTSSAFVDARDMVLVLDYSGSMNYDSLLTSSLGTTQAQALLDAIWDSLVTANPQWPGTTQSKFPSTGFGKMNSYAGVSYTSSTDTTTIRNWLGLSDNVGGHRKYPFPQAGRNADGSPKSKPSDATSDSLWNGYIDYVKGSTYLPSAYSKKYGYRTLMHYLQERPSYAGWRPREQSEDLWRTPHYPMQAVKDGASMFLNFLHDLNFGDEVGLVGYAGQPSSGVGGWIIDKFYDGDVNLDISSDPITSNYTTIDTILRHHQAGENGGQTAMGDGIKKAVQLLGTSARAGARPTIVLMTDGVPNETPSSWSLPAGFNWAAWTDYDNNGVANYVPTGTATEKIHKSYAFWQATEAIKKGITIHTVCVGALGDTELMKAIAFAGGGVYSNVPGGATVADMHNQLVEAFNKIAAKVPPPKLIQE
jgi:Flp pilus assembly protein TadG